MESRGDVPFHRTLRFKLLLAIVGSLGILSLFLIQYGYSVARDALVEGTIEDLKQSTQLATNELQSTLDFYDRGILDRPEALEIIDRNLAGEIRQIRIRLDVEELDQVQRLFPEIFRRGELDWIDPVIQDMDNASEFPGINEELDHGSPAVPFLYRDDQIGWLLNLDGQAGLLITDPELNLRLFRIYLQAGREQKSRMERILDLRIMRDPATVTVQAAGDGYVYVLTQYTPGWLLPGTSYPEDYSRQAIKDRMDAGLPQLDTPAEKQRYMDLYGSSAEEQYYFILEFMLRDNNPPLPIYAVAHPNLGFRNADSIESYGDRSVRKKKIGRDLAVAANGVYEYWWKNPGEKKARKKLAHYRNFHWDSKDGSWSVRWVVSAAAYEDQAFAVLSDVRLKIYVVSGLLALLTVLGLLYLFRTSVLAGFEDLVTGSRNILKKNFYVRIPVRGTDEISTVARAMNLVLEKVGESREHVESIARELKVRSKSESDLQQLTRDLYVRSAMDIRSRMEGMIRVAEALQGAHFTDGVLRREVDTLLESGLRLRSFVNDFYEFSLIRSGSIPPAPSCVPVEPAVHFSFNRAQEIAEVQSSVNLIMANRHLHLDVDPVFLEAIFVNLFHYCLDRQKKGRLDLEIQDQGRWIGFQLTLRDTVMDSREAVAAFDFFLSIVDNPGAGTGLALCRLWIEAMGGKITLASESDLGTRFLFTLPSHPGPGVDPGQFEHTQNLASYLEWASPREDEGDRLVSILPPWTMKEDDLQNYARFYGEEEQLRGRLYSGKDTEGYMIVLSERDQSLQKAYDFQDSALVYQQALGHKGRSAGAHFVSMMRARDPKFLAEVHRWQQWLSVPFLIEGDMETPEEALRRKVLILKDEQNQQHEFYELYRPGDYLNPLRKKTLQDFEKGVEEFFANRRDQAFWLFEEVLREDPSDRVASSFAYRNFWK
ncbi:MAG: hypothetical protein CMN77_04100 [Spirochaetaceae bacterium]|nr:hypothetical protein [Spirochaetaceae bacterium]